MHFRVVRRKKYTQKTQSKPRLQRIIFPTFVVVVVVVVVVFLGLVVVVVVVVVVLSLASTVNKLVNNFNKFVSQKFMSGWNSKLLQSLNSKTCTHWCVEYQGQCCQVLHLACHSYNGGVWKTRKLWSKWGSSLHHLATRRVRRYLRFGGLFRPPIESHYLL